MNEIKDFRDLDAWKVNHRAALGIYRLTKNFPNDERFGIIDQLRRAASSVTANIAEGWGRFHFADRVRFYHQARGSSCEVQNFLVLAKDLQYLTDSQYKEIQDIVFQGFLILNGLIRSVEKKMSG